MKELKFINENLVEIDGQKFRKEETLPSEPKFKVGDYIWFYDDLKRITEIKKEDSRGACEKLKVWSNDNCLCDADDQAFHVGTPQQIEAHLRKITKEKYIGKKVKSVGDGHIETLVKNIEVFIIDDDHSVFCDGLKGGACKIYHNGKWAEILPNKHPLPKTQEEFTLFLKEFSSFERKYNLKGILEQDFLDQYDFNE